MQPTFCFIDDADFELDNFQKNVAPAFKGIEFVYARDFDRALHKLSGRRCLCFLLDIYGTAAGGGSGEFPAPESLAPALGQGYAVESLYDDLQGKGSEKANQFLRRLYARVQAAQEAFGAAAGQLGQGPAFGLDSLAKVREHQPWAAALGYSRKALYADAAAMCMGGADGVLQKPQGADEAAIAKASHLAAPELAKAAFAAVDRRLAGMAGQVGLRLCWDGVSLSMAEALQQAVGQLTDREKRSPEARGKALEGLKAVRLDDLEMDQGDVEVILALWDWLSLET
jgi:hypothetical protein